MDPKNNQKFTVTDDELAQLPDEIKQMASFHSHLMSENLIKLIANDEKINLLIYFLMNIFYQIKTFHRLIFLI